MGQVSLRPSRRLAVVAAAVTLAPALAVAQPIDPYGAPPPPTATPAPPPAQDDVGPAVAAALLDRARALAAMGELDAARQLASEAAAGDPAGPTGAAARALIDELDARLGRTPPPVVDVPSPPVVDVAPPSAVVDLPPAVDQPPPPSNRSARTAAALYGALGGAALGLGLAGTDGDTGAGVLGGAAVGGLTGYYLARRGGWELGRAHQLGAGVVWGGAVGALFADVVTGTTDTDEDDIAAGAGLGALGGAVVGALAGADPRLTTGDLALVDSLTAWGLIGGLTTAVAIDPPEGEAYSLNAALGIAAGYAVGQVAARRVDISGRRLLRVNAIALLGAAVPILIWRATDDSTDLTADASSGAQAAGLLATVGLVGGAYLGFRWTRGMDRAATSAADPGAPAALIQRGADGRWDAGGLALAPVRHGRGAALTILGGRW